MLPLSCPPSLSLALAFNTVCVRMPMCVCMRTYTCYVRACVCDVCVCVYQGLSKLWFCLAQVTYKAILFPAGVRFIFCTYSNNTVGKFTSPNSEIISTPS